MGPAKAPAEEAPPRAERNVADQQFAQLMSRGLAHADRAEWPDAERAFRAAAQLRPADRAAADGLARAKEGLERSQVAALQNEAQRFESEERWADALAAYRQALRIDPTLEFARLGSERSERMARLHAELDAMLADPKRLYSPRVRDAARKALAAADAVPGGGPRLAEARARLDAALHRATTPIAVHLTSDEVTDVTVYRVGPLGRFQARDLELVPGTYTVVGARAGYKDVRIELTVEPDAPAPKVFVACREPV
jgi:tetratricopeptide (TPR) repeat protein